MNIVLSTRTLAFVLAAGLCACGSSGGGSPGGGGLGGGAGGGSANNGGAAGRTGAGGIGGTGVAGSVGAAGSVGTAGSTGAAGSAGTAGSTAAAGSAGAAGNLGTAGSTGAAGNAGTGAAGAAGTVACNTLTSTGWNPAGVHKVAAAGSPPVPAGGTIVDGTYILTREDVYPPDAADTMPIGATISFAGNQEQYFMDYESIGIAIYTNYTILDDRDDLERDRHLFVEQLPRNHPVDRRHRIDVSLYRDGRDHPAVRRKSGPDVHQAVVPRPTRHDCTAARIIG